MLTTRIRRKPESDDSHTVSASSGVVASFGCDIHTIYTFRDPLACDGSLKPSSVMHFFTFLDTNDDMHVSEA